MRALRRSLPGHSPREAGVKADQHGRQSAADEGGARNIAFFETLPENDRARVDFANVRGVQFLEPLFEFSGACGGCGETPYLKLLSQLFGDRRRSPTPPAAPRSMAATSRSRPGPKTAKAAGRHGRTRCSRIMPSLASASGCGRQASGAGARIARAAGVRVGRSSCDAILRRRKSENPKSAPAYPGGRVEDATAKDRKRAARDLLSVVDHLVRRSIWIVGGDGWAYDIGYGGLDHVLASGRDVNVLVLDTEVYSNTGGQASKATPLGAVAKFAAAGKRVRGRTWRCRRSPMAMSMWRRSPWAPIRNRRCRRSARQRPMTGLADPRLQPLHRAWHRHALRHEAAGSGRGQRLLAPVPLQSGDAEGGRKSVPPGFAAPDYSIEGLCIQRAPLHRARVIDAGRCCGLLTMAQAVVTEKYRQYEDLAAREGSRFHPNADDVGRGGEL